MNLLHIICFLPFKILDGIKQRNQNPYNKQNNKCRVKYAHGTGANQQIFSNKQNSNKCSTHPAAYHFTLAVTNRTWFTHNNTHPLHNNPLFCPD